MSNTERITKEANTTDTTSPDFNPDMDITIAGCNGKTYRDLILAGFDPNDHDDLDEFRAQVQGL